MVKLPPLAHNAVLVPALTEPFRQQLLLSRKENPGFKGISGEFAITFIGLPSDSTVFSNERKTVLPFSLKKKKKANANV